MSEAGSVGDFSEPQDISERKRDQKRDYKSSQISDKYDEMRSYKSDQKEEAFDDLEEKKENHVGLKKRGRKRTEDEKYF